MLILMISDVYFPRINGVSTSIQTFMHELTQLGHEVTLIAPDYGGESRTVFDAETGIIRIPARKVWFDPEDRFMQRRAIQRIVAHLKKRDYDLVHIQTPFVAHSLGVWLADQLSVPCVETYHTYFEEYLYHYLPLLPKQLMRYLAKQFTLRACNQVDQVIVPSTAMRDVLTQYGVKTTMQILPTGLPQQDFTRGNGNRFRYRMGIAVERPVMVTIGRVAFEKNIDFLVDVTHQVRRSIANILFLIAGEGPMQSHLKRRIQNEGLEENIQLIGYLERERELKDCYSAADVFVFASRTETQGLVLLEAMAQGTAVVSTAMMGTRDVLQERQGCLIAEEQVELFAEKVVQVLRDADLQQQLSETGRQYARQWNASQLAEKLAIWYQDVNGRAPDIDPMLAAVWAAKGP